MQYSTLAAEPFDLFTGGKHAEMAIAFNIACDNLTGYISTLMNWKHSPNAFQLIASFSDETFVNLRQYLWKGNEENKNNAGYALDPVDKIMITQLLQKLGKLRNFHSHYWHENSSLEFNILLKQFVQDKHDQVCLKLGEDNSYDAELYFRQQQRHPIFNRNFITQEGRLFFLSFFLNKGQMQHLLQRRKGSKRNDLPEYQFKHKVYTYFCHREGSSWLTHSIDNDKLPTMREEERKRIYHGRQANRILSHLKDRPLPQNAGLLPLILATGEKVHDMNSLLEFIEQRELLPGFRFYEKDTLDTPETIDPEKEYEDKKRSENMLRQGFRFFMHPEDQDYEFQISYTTLRQIITGIFLDRNDPASQNKGFDHLFHFKKVLEDCIGTRRYIYKELSTVGDQQINSDSYKLEKKYSSIYIDYSRHVGSIKEMYYSDDEWRAIPISPNAKVEKLLIEWHNSFTQGKPGELERRKKLLNSIRPLNSPFDLSLYSGKLRNGMKKVAPGLDSRDPEPLLFHLAYYFRELGSNLRKTDNFLEWGIRYLMDMGLVPDWYFEMDQLAYEPKFGQPESAYNLKKVTKWAKAIPDNFKLRTIDNQVNIGIRLEGRDYRLRIGERTLRYLLYSRFQDGTKKSINQFLMAVVRDLAKLHKSQEPIPLERLELLESFAIPPLFFKTKVESDSGASQTPPSYKEEAYKYFLHKIQSIDSQLNHLMRLTRNGKNELLMDTYRLFDFSVTEGSKFLRKNEYKQLSICHYMLNQDTGKVRSLIEKTFRLKKRLPEELLNLIYDATRQDEQALDYLCIQVLNNRKKFLQDRMNLLDHPGLKPPKIRKEIIGFLPIYFDDQNLKEEELIVRNLARLNSLDHLPFCVHPSLVLKYLYPEKFAAKSFCKEGGTYTNIFRELRTKQRLALALPSDNFREDATKNVVSDYFARFPEDVELLKWSKKWIGQVNDIKAKDILLLLIAKDYLDKYDPHSAKAFDGMANLKTLNLEQLFSNPVVVPMQINDTSFHLQLQFHQLDDYFYRSQKETLEELSIFYVNWRNEEIERYQDNQEIVEQLSKWPDGTPENPLTLGKLIEARKVNANQAAELTQHIFNYEAMVINEHFTGMGKLQKQRELLQYCHDHENAYYISFSTIMEWDSKTSPDLKNKIGQLRSNCLHNSIPPKVSYRNECLPGSLIGEILHVHKPLGKDRAEINNYELNMKG